MGMEIALTHAELCAIAVRWLKKSPGQGGPGCNLAISECTSTRFGEIPDALGFRYVNQEQYSVLVEVKTSRADFLADANKPHRIDASLGLGVFRYFMAPVGLIAREELPSRWGLIEVDGRKPIVRAGHVLEKRREELKWDWDRASWENPNNHNQEISFLVRLFARIGDPECLQRELKLARNAQSRAAQDAEDYRRKLERAEDRILALRNVADELANTKATPRAHSLAS